jgi:hypothetical protein
MPDNVSSDSAFVVKVTCSTSDQQVDLLRVTEQVTLVADADCFVNFDKPVTTLGRFLLKANIPVTLDIECSNIHYLTASATPAIYIVATT